MPSVSTIGFLSAADPAPPSAAWGVINTVATQTVHTETVTPTVRSHITSRDGSSV